MTKQTHIILSAGGTGGHVLPARALAEDLRARGAKVSLVTDPRGQRFTSLFEGFDVYVIPSGTLRRGLRGKIEGVLSLAQGYLKAAQLLRRLEPDGVVGFGGYPSVPAVLAAQHARIPTILHEQNAVLGKANAMLAKRAQRIALSLSQIPSAYADKMIVTGNPVRPEIAALHTAPYPALTEDGPLNILVMGGSLGATIFSDVVPKACEALAPACLKRLRIVQQCRAEDVERTQKTYAALDIEAEIAPFFDDIPDRLAAAHLIISRSGASTVAEVSAAGRPAIFVPYPHHKDQQQKVNAETLADAGGAWVMEQDGFTPETLAAKLEIFLQTPAILVNAANASKSVAKPDAAKRLGDVVMGIN